MNSRGSLVGSIVARRVATLEQAVAQQEEEFDDYDYFKDYKVGDKVEAAYDTDAYYPGEVVAVNEDGTFLIKWDDPEDGPEEEVRSYKELQYPRLTADQIEIGDSYTGVVLSVQKFGAFIDFGAEENALVPNRLMSNGFRAEKDSTDMVGQEVQIWITQVEESARGLRIAASMTEGTEAQTWSQEEQREPRLTADQIEVGDSYTGVVLSVQKFGAFIDFGAQENALVPNRLMSNEFIADIESTDVVGQEVQIWITQVEESARGLRLAASMVEEAEAQHWSQGSYSQPRSQGSFSDLAQKFKDFGRAEWIPAVVNRLGSVFASVTATLPDGTQGRGSIHISQLAEHHVDRIEDMLEEGQDIQVKMRRVNADREELEFSMLDNMRFEQSLEDYPSWDEEGQEGEAAEVTFDEVLQRFEDFGSSEWIPAKVGRLNRKFAKVTAKLPDGTQGHGAIHVRQMSEEYVANPWDVLSEGQVVEVKFQGVSGGKVEELQFSMLENARPRGAGRQQPIFRKKDPAVFAEFEDLQDEWLKGVVSGTKPFGAFVDLTHPTTGSKVSGMVHVSQLANEYVESVESIVDVGQEVDVWIVEVNPAECKLQLSMRT